MNKEVRELTFNTTIESRGRMIKGWLRKKISNEEDAKDVYQEIMKDFWGYLGRHEGDYSPATPLFTITHRRVYDYYRKKYREKELMQEKSVVDYFSKSRMFRINMLLHPIWRKHLSADQSTMLRVIRKTLKNEAVE